MVNAYMTYIVSPVTTCRPGRGHIVAAARLQLVYLGHGAAGRQVYGRNVGRRMVVARVRSAIELES